ncbi:hypothetical protein [Streptomyces zaehneri]|uniref:hypothetical protein n=1 Tax=Streptomyces zaehneri TaxID=3051180 RepID=UPI0028D09110|nr:hypothetical protein [Streptomyces sp. DSM 40713]
MVAIKTTSSGRKLAHCTDCHLHKLTNAAAPHEPRATTRAAAPTLGSAESAEYPEPAQVVLIQQPDPGQPYDVVATESALRWTFVIRQRHLDHGHCPLPAQAVRRIRTAKVVHLHDGHGFPKVLAVSLGKRITKGRLQGIHWPHTQVVPGTRVTAELDRSRLRLFLTPLERPVFIAMKRLLYEYDARIIARELPTILTPGGGHAASSLDLLVQETIRKLGYLDEEGHALLPMENLIRNVRSRSASERYSSETLRASVDGLISRKRLTWETGSCAADGILNFPACPGERRIRLVCYTPFVLPEHKKKQPRIVHLPSASSQHGVAGHLMRIDHLGKEASDAAQAAYTEAHRSAGLTGSHKLPEGRTYVRPHMRGGK